MGARTSALEGYGDDFACALFDAVLLFDHLALSVRVLVTGLLTISVKTFVSLLPRVVPTGMRVGSLEAVIVSGRVSEFVTDHSVLYW